jgi:hypothetical protein
MRRGMCAWTTKDYNRLFVSVLAAARQAAPEAAGDAVRDTLARQTADSRKWPTDGELIDALLAPDVYHPPYRARLKAFLVGLENHLRTRRTEPLAVLSRGDSRMNVEHVMPQTWEPNWPLPAHRDVDPLARRENAVHRLGNLTLTTVKLNSALSNNPWTVKRPDLQRHSLLLLTTASVLSPPEGASGWTENAWAEGWDEDRIDLRGLYLAHHALRAWPPTRAHRRLTARSLLSRRGDQPCGQDPLATPAHRHERALPPLSKTSRNRSYLGTVPMTKIHDCQSIGHRVGGTGLSGPGWRRRPASRRCQPELCGVAPCRLLWRCWACRSRLVAALSSLSRIRPGRGTVSVCGLM